jgi:hypothetical protein
MDVWTYFEQREREFKDLSLVPLSSRNAMFAEEEGSNGRRGRVIAELMLTERSRLFVHEVVVVVGGRSIRREEYAYYLVVDDEEVWGYDRDPSHSPAVHGHVGAGHQRRNAPRVTFKQAVGQAWTDISTLEA